MDPLLAGLAALVGVLVGVAVTVPLLLRGRASPRRTDLPRAGGSAALPSGVADVLAALPSSAVVLDREDRVVHASPSAPALGLVRGGALRSEELLDLVRLVRRDRGTREAEVRLPRGQFGTSTRSVLARVTPLGSSLVLVLVEDRTEARRVDEVRRDFVANVSHELKTPVGAMALLSEALLDAADDPEAVRRFAGRVKHESDRLTMLVQDVIELSRLQGHDPLATADVVRLDDVVAEAIDRHRLPAEARQISLVCGGVPGIAVLGDPRQLVTALGNLVDNAVRYAPPGTRVAVAVTQSGAGPAAVAEISVSDEGPGIAAGERDRIFERFYRVDAARSRDTGGTGLGLSIVKHVAAGHGGEVTVWSSEGTGSTFTLRLPAAVPSVHREETE